MVIKQSSQQPFNAQHFDTFHSNNYLASAPGQKYVDSIPIPHIKEALQQHIQNHNELMGSFNTTLNDNAPTMADLMTPMPTVNPHQGDIPPTSNLPPLTKS